MKKNKEIMLNKLYTSQTELAVKDRIAEQIAWERITTDPELQKRQNELFGLALDQLFSLPPEERIRTLGGLKPGSDKETAISPKRWADQEAKTRILAQIKASLSEEEITYYQNTKNNEGKQRRETKRLKDYQTAAKELNLSPLSETFLSNLTNVDKTIEKMSTTPPVNKRLLQQYLVQALASQLPLTLFYVKCPRFAFPNGNLEIIPNLDEFAYQDINGNLVIKSSAKESLWFENTLELRGLLKTNGVPSNVIVAVADTDFTDVRGYSKESQIYKNVLAYTQALRQRYPNLRIETFSSLQEKLGVTEIYDQLFFSSAAFLFGNMVSCDNSQLEGYIRILSQKGFSQGFIVKLRTAFAQNKKTDFFLNIASKTLSQVNEEERESQLRTFPPEKCDITDMAIYSILRISRDIAQVGVVIPTSGCNAIYVSDRKLKAVEFGYYGNRLRKRPIQPTIFQKYETD